MKSQVIMEPVRISQKLMSDPGVDPAFVDQAIGYVLSQIDRNLQSFTRLFPASASKQAARLSRVREHRLDDRLLNRHAVARL